MDALVGGQDGEALKFLKDKVDFSIVNVSKATSAHLKDIPKDLVGRLWFL